MSSENDHKTTPGVAPAGVRIVAVREHYFDAGHRVYLHEGKCASPHGHGYRVELHCEATRGGLDALGRVVDFGVIKSAVCSWIDENLDHKFLVMASDPLCDLLREASPEAVFSMDENPTAENIAKMLLGIGNGLLQVVAPDIRLFKVVCHETVKCRAEVSL